MYGTFTSKKEGMQITHGSSIFGNTGPTATYVANQQTVTTRTGQVTANYHKLVKTLPRLPPNEFSYVQTFENGGAGRVETVWHNYTKQRQVTTGDFALNSPCPLPALMSISSAAVQSAEADVVNKLLLKIKDQKVNLIQAFAEREQTVRLFAGTATKVAKALLAVKKGQLLVAATELGLGSNSTNPRFRLPSKRAQKRFARDVKKAKNPAEQEKAFTSGWLQLQYGWNPLLQDVYGSAELIAQKRVREILGDAKQRKRFVFDEVRDLQADGWKGKSYLHTDMDISYVITYSPVDEVAHTLTQMGFTNPLLIAWELMPWSFVIDWFIPFGNYLSSLDATNGTKFVQGSETIFVKKTGFIEWSATDIVGGDAHTNGTVWKQKTETSVRRIPLKDFPRARFPNFKNPLSVLHALNAISLLIQLRK